MGKETKPSSAWGPAEQELAISLRAKSSIRDVSLGLKTAGYNRSPKAVEKFFERIGLTVRDAKVKAGVLPVAIAPDEMAEIYSHAPLLTTWGEPMIVPDLSIEFGQGTSVVPVMILPDIHCPFQDNKAIELACKIIELVKPVTVIYLGDNVDWHQISKFDKDPDRILTLQAEVDKFHEVDRMIMSAAGKHVKRYYILGNHEDRLRRYHSEHPEVSKVRGLQFDSLLGLGPTMKTIPNLQLVEEEINWRDRFIFKHGKIVSKWSGWSAQKEHMAEHRNGISGHTHRAGDYYMTQRGRSQKWTESGCLCSLEPTYMRNPNWQAAVTVGYFNGDGTNDFFHTNLVVFSKYQAIVEGQYLSVKDDKKVMSKL
jgi:predicted phosphodiesterase